MKDEKKAKELERKQQEQEEDDYYEDEYEGEIIDIDEENEESGERAQEEAAKDSMEKLEEQAKEYWDELVGRYIPGYRHYENYELYSLKYPGRDINDYVDDMNREVTFEEYLDINLTALRFY